ncbi:class I adenylate-forming enzyme family protein [Streptomyces tirandamycinicus]|uniref:class I adenylate-forming enzyme family protein n=1 Tax=Streptomyces tirandamycinicus TaxID=2174846 RepID=UPI002271C818|nr:AMP-binding protein [Streptomyces tirandamycinicus]MCY0983634.1 AMP-binding protein [Streptomyces tirandamycinicus]
MTNFVRRLAETALSRGWLERPAYHVDERVHRFEDVLAGADRAAAAFASRGLGPGVRILIALPDGIEFVWAFLGAMRIGAVAVPVNSMFHPDEMRQAAGIAQPAAVVSDPGFAGRFTVPVLTPDALRSEARVPPYAPATDDTPAFAAFTSGTTGGPKLCFHTHGDPEVLTRAAGAAVGVTADDVSYSVPRMNFAYGLGNSLFFPLMTGGAAVLTPRRLAPGDSLAVLEKYGVTVFYSQPTFFAHMLGHPDARRVLGGLRTAVVAGEVLPDSLERRLRDILGPRLLNVYGTTEIGHAVLANGPGSVREFTLGRALDPYRLRVVDDAGVPVPAGVEGRLEVSGPTIGLGVPRGGDDPVRLAPGEWYSTSDAATVDADGFVRVHGRLDDVEIVGGINVHPAEIEDRLMAHPAVEEAAVCAVRRDSGISVLRAHAVLRHALDETAEQALRDELLGACRSSLTWYKVPEDVTFVARLPRNPTGKLLRRTVRALAAEDALR